MQRRSETLRAIGTLAVGAWLGLAQAQDTSRLPDDDVLELAVEQHTQGHPWQAEALLRGLAQAGNVVAMERLALMHWYGPVLYPQEAWSRTLATTWFERAAERGSVLGRHMAKVALASARSAQSAGR